MPLNLVARRDGPQMLVPLETSRMLLTAGSARRPEQPAPVMHRAGSSGSKKLSSSVCAHHAMRRLLTATPARTIGTRICGRLPQYPCRSEARGAISQKPRRAICWRAVARRCYRHFSATCVCVRVCVWESRGRECERARARESAQLRQKE